MEIGLAATEVISTGVSTGKAGLLENEPRFDYSGGVTCPSLLKEKPRTNLITYSEYIAGLSIASNATLSLESETNPSGSEFAYRVTATEASSRVQRSIGTQGNNFVFSGFFKGSGAATRIRFRNNQGEGVFYNIDANGAFTLYSENAVNDNYGIRDYGNGWHRIFFETTTSNSSVNYAQVYGDILDGDGSVLVWGLQAEQGDYPTSYIPNHSGGTITRSDESANYVTVGGGSEKWSLMYEFDFNKTPLQQNEIFSNIRNATSDVAITFRHFIRDSVKHVISPYFNLEPAYPFGSAGASSVTDSSVLLRANGDGSYDYFASLNGVVTKASVTGMSNIAFSRIDLGAGASTAHKKVILFANTLSDADCTALIGTSYDTFADMAEALNYTVYE